MADFHPLQATIAGRYGTERGLVTIYCEWDETTKVWRGSSTGLRLETAAPSLDALMAKVGEMLGNAG